MAADGASLPVGDDTSPAKLTTAWPLADGPGRTLATFVLYASPFVATALGYEVLRLLIQYRGEIHVGDLYAFEERLFPVATSEGTRALSEVIARAVHPALDVLCGATYLLFIFEVFGLAGYLFWRARRKMLELSLGFLAINLAGWAIWLAYPAAPPWYVDMYGTGPALLDAAASPAGLLRVDDYLPFPVAATFYAKSANVFGAMPSLHCAYATLAAYVVFPLGGRLRIGLLAYAASMAFSAVYLRHHYIIDVIAGVALALPFALLTRRILDLRMPSVEAPR